MAVYIKWDGRDILRCRNSFIAIFYEDIEDTIRENKIQLNEDLTETIKTLDQAGYGIGLDLAEYLHTKDDILRFLDLIRKGIDKYNQKTPNASQDARDLLEGFYQELVKIAKTFPK